MKERFVPNRLRAEVENEGKVLEECYFLVSDLMQKVEATELAAAAKSASESARQARLEAKGKYGDTISSSQQEASHSQ